MKMRLYNPLDLDGCLAVFASNLAPYVSAQEMTDFWRFLREQANIDCPYLVAEEEGQILACGGLHLDLDRGVATLCWGLVHREHHRKKLGTVMLVERLNWAASSPALTKVEMNTSQHTVAFFQRFGFVPLRRIAGGYGGGLDRIDLELTLRPEVRRLFGPPAFEGILPVRDWMGLRLVAFGPSEGEDFSRMCASLSREQSDGIPVSGDRARRQLPWMAGSAGLISALYLELGPRRVGYVLLGARFSHELGGRCLAIESIYVEPGQRRAGLGGQALALVQRWAGDRGFLALSLTVGGPNGAAASVFAKAGFERLDQGLMVKRLPPPAPVGKPPPRRP